MSSRLLQQRPLLTLPQLLLLLALLAGLVIVLDLNKRAEGGEMAGVAAEELQQQMAYESTRQVTLQATKVYVQSDDYVEDYARDEAGYILPGEKRVSPVIVSATPIVVSEQNVRPDPAQYARPWQAWLRLLTDIPFPRD